MIVTAKSEYGFKTDINTVWFKCDKYFLKSDLFKSLKKGDDINSVMFNKNNFVKSFIVLHHKDQGEEENISKNFTSLKSTHTLNSLKSNSLPVSSSLNINAGRDVLEREEVFLNPQNVKPSSVQDSIRYAQCVNIAFASVNLGGFITEEAGIIYAFDRADKIFKEFNKRCSR
jgi:hypothetical protein